MSKRVLVCGDRDWNDPLFIQYAINIVHQIYGPIDCIIEGECKGADKHARLAGEKLGIKVERYPADWKRYGNAAGPIRNQQMLDEGNPDLVLAFHNKIDQSVGTADMIMRAKKRGIKVRVIKSKD